MPRPGYKSITVANNVEKLLKERYEKNKEKYLEKYNITSFSGYLLYLTQLEDETDEKHSH